MIVKNTQIYAVQINGPLGDLSKNQVVTITEFLSLFVAVIINIYIQ